MLLRVYGRNEESRRENEFKKMEKQSERTARGGKVS